ncbi:hypothetical protein NQZ68_009012 [Dissostichus eleginoides]|nr:hypothetical protein NQZ68_009012 [Dissostichus eleginoides]
MRVLFGDLLDCDRERASTRNAPWVFVWVLTQCGEQRKSTQTQVQRQREPVVGKKARGLSTEHDWKGIQPQYPYPVQLNPVHEVCACRRASPEQPPSRRAFYGRAQGGLLQPGSNQRLKQAWKSGKSGAKCGCHFLAVSRVAESATQSQLFPSSPPPRPPSPVEPAWGRSHDRGSPALPCARRAPVSSSPFAPSASPAVRGCPAVTVAQLPLPHIPNSPRRENRGTPPPMPTGVSADSFTLHNIQRIQNTEGNSPDCRTGSDRARRLSLGQVP